MYFLLYIYYIMPYFHKDDINLLLIHIPKTGGSSLEKYVSKKYKIPLNDTSLFTLRKKFQGVSYQHQTYNSIMTYFVPKMQGFYKQEDLSILTIVRNPYHRIVSDLFFFNYINKNNTPSQSQVFDAINYKYLNQFGNHDNHKRPQYQFVIDEQTGKLIDKLIILKTETLTKDMHQLGYTDFNINVQSSHINKDYMSFLNKQSIQLINKAYYKDFQYFGYTMVQ